MEHDVFHASSFSPESLRRTRSTGFRWIKMALNEQEGIDDLSKLLVQLEESWSTEISGIAGTESPHIMYGVQTAPVARTEAVLRCTAVVPHNQAAARHGAATETVLHFGPPQVTARTIHVYSIYILRYSGFSTSRTSVVQWPLYATRLYTAQHHESSTSGATARYVVRNSNFEFSTMLVSPL